MKRLLLLFAVTCSILSCNQQKNQLIGTWIEYENFNSPYISLFDEDYIYFFQSIELYQEYMSGMDIDSMIYNYLVHKMPYELNSDTLRIQTDELVLWRLKINDNVLTLQDFEDDSMFITYEKMSALNVVDYFNNKKGTNLELVVNEQKVINYGRLGEYLHLLDHEDKQLFLSGKETTLDTTLYLKLTHFQWYRHPFCLYIDKNVEMKVVNQLRKQLHKSGNVIVHYISKNEMNELSATGLRLPGWQNNYPDSLKKLIQPAFIYPELPKNKESFQGKTLVEVHPGAFLINDTLTDYGTFAEMLSAELEIRSKPEYFLFVSDQNKYEDFLNFYINTLSVYYKFRDEYSIEKFNEREFTNLDYEEAEIVREVFPFLVREINEEEMKELKNFLR